MSKPFYTSAAHHDLTDILGYIADDNPTAALNWMEKIEKKCLLIAGNPSIGEAQPQLGAGVRASFVGRYVIFYRAAHDVVQILRVIAGDRDITRL